jgi:hypothetical protein
MMDNIWTEKLAGIGKSKIILLLQLLDNIAIH